MIQERLVVLENPQARQLHQLNKTNDATVISKLEEPEHASQNMSQLSVSGIVPVAPPNELAQEEKKETSNEAVKERSIESENTKAEMPHESAVSLSFNNAPSFRIMLQLSTDMREG